MAIKNKKGFALPDVLLSVVVMGVITSGLIQFFSSLQSEQNSPQNLVMELNFLHQKLNLVDPVSTDMYLNTSSGKLTAITPNTDLLYVAFNELFKDNISKIKSFSVVPVKYTHKDGLLLQIPITHPTISCSSLLRYKFGYSTISISSSSAPVLITSLDRTKRLSHCDSYKVGSNWVFHLK